MPKTRRDLLHAIADKIGGAPADKLRAFLSRKTIIDDMLDRPISDEEFAQALQDAEHGLPKVFAKMKGPEWATSAEWGLN